MPTILANFIQLPHEPSSGAARSMRTICELLALGGWRVQVLGTTATEGDVRLDAQDWLRSSGIKPAIDTGPQSSRIFRFQDRGVDYVLLDVGTVDAAEAEQHVGDAFDQLFNEILAAVQPDIFLTYGGWLPELERRRRARDAGIRVVFTVRNQAYLCPQAFVDVDATFASSRFLADLYMSTLGVEVTVPPMPVAADDVIAVSRNPTFVTFVNPEPIKGVVAFARIADEISSRRPDIPLLVVKSRSAADVLLATALAGGFDLRRHSNIAVAEPVPDPRRIYAVTRVLVVPSLEEASGRVAAEALLNGIPVIASDRGGLPETLRGGGFVLPLPADMTVDTIVPPPADALERWVDLIIQLMTDEAFYQQATHRARQAGGAYDQRALISAYCSFFREILGASQR